MFSRCVDNLFALRLYKRGKADKLGLFPKCGGVELKFRLVLGPLLWNNPNPRTLPYTKESPTHVKLCLKVSFVFEELLSNATSHTTTSMMEDLLL
jgi:hypothetical protein